VRFTPPQIRLANYKAEIDLGAAVAAVEIGALDRSTEYTIFCAAQVLSLLFCFFVLFCSALSSCQAVKPSSYVALRALSISTTSDSFSPSIHLSVACSHIDNTKGPDGSPSPWSESVELALTARTGCCKRVSVEFVSGSNFVQGRAAAAALDVRLLDPLSDGECLRLRFAASVGAGASRLFLPSQLNFTRDGGSQVRSVRVGSSGFCLSPCVGLSVYI
jgi:hypothetical protein